MLVKLQDFFQSPHRAFLFQLAVGGIFLLMVNKGFLDREKARPFSIIVILVIIFFPILFR